MLQISYSTTSGFWDWLTVFSTFYRKGSWGPGRHQTKERASNVPLWQRNVFCKVKLALSGIACVLKFCILYFPESISRVCACSTQQHSKDLFTHLVKINMFSICLELLNECPENMMQDEKLIWCDSRVRPPMNSLIFIACQLCKTLLRSFQFWNVCGEIKSPPESIKKLWYLSGVENFLQVYTFYKRYKYINIHFSPLLQNIFIIECYMGSLHHSKKKKRKWGTSCFPWKD